MIKENPNHDLKEYYLNTPQPTMDIKAQVLKRIQQDSRARKKPLFKPILLWSAVLLCAVFIMGFAYNEGLFWKMIGIDGTIKGTIPEIEIENHRNLAASENPSRSSFYDDLVKEMDPGTGIAVYDMTAKHFQVTIKPLEIQEWNEMKAVMTEGSLKTTLPDALPGGYFFNHGTVSYHNVFIPSIEEVEKNGIVNGQYITMNIPLSDKISNVGMQYSNGTAWNAAINIHASYSEMPKVSVTTSPDTTTEILELEGYINAMYVYSEESGRGRLFLIKELPEEDHITLIVTDEQQNKQYTMTNKYIFYEIGSYSASRDELLNAALLIQ